MADKRVYYGGQAVIEGVMIRGPRGMAIACRKPDGDVIVRAEPLGGVYTGWMRHLPLVRGMIVLWETLALGIRALVWSSNVQLGQEEAEPDTGPMWTIAIASTVIIGGIF